MTDSAYYDTMTIAQTASKKEEMANREESVLFQDFIRKPVDLNKILEMIKNIA